MIDTVEAVGCQMEIVDSQRIRSDEDVRIDGIEAGKAGNAAFAENRVLGINPVAVQESFPGRQLGMGRIPVSGLAEHRGNVEAFAFAFVIFLEAEDSGFLLLNEIHDFIFDFAGSFVGNLVKVEHLDIVGHQLDGSVSLPVLEIRFMYAFELEDVLQVIPIEQQASQKEEASFSQKAEIEHEQNEPQDKEDGECKAEECREE